MSRLEVDKERFKEFLDQFVGDAPYQTELIYKILNQMPTQVSQQLIEELYYKYVYDGPLFIATHAVFKSEVHYFPNYESLTKFLNEVNKFTSEYNTDALLTIDVKSIQKRMKDGIPLCGYMIEMKGVKEDERPKPTVTRYSQFQ